MLSIAGFDSVINVEHWTSAAGQGNLKWCNGETSVKEANWKNGVPNIADGQCLFIVFSNNIASQTTVSLGDCNQKRKFICEVKIRSVLATQFN